MPTVAVNPPKTPVTAGSNSFAAATVPNVCKMPGPPAPFVPTPLPNIGKSGASPKNFSKTVTIEGHAVAIQGSSFGSMGDVASKGTGGGIVSNNVEGPTTFVGPGSMNVQFEGKNVQYLGDPMLNNGGPTGNPANAATLAGVTHVALPLSVIEELLCSLFCECLVMARAQKWEISLPDMAVIEEPGFDQSQKPGKSQYQACVEQRFNKDYKDKISNLKAEQSFDMKNKDSDGNPIALPDSARGTPGTRRPDFVVLNSPGYRAIEMKFPGDRWGPGQKAAYQRISGGALPIELNEKTCNC
ncbi:MAG TPA: PAAR-like domain-containing protein [Archangium sp.]|nr:PAAR-like domain-containing protein [Archangium sp.]